MGPAFKAAVVDIDHLAQVCWAGKIVAATIELDHGPAP